jgi:hypothetical protein
VIGGCLLSLIYVILVSEPNNCWCFAQMSRSRWFCASYGWSTWRDLWYSSIGFEDEVAFEESWVLLA